MRSIREPHPAAVPASGQHRPIRKWLTGAVALATLLGTGLFGTSLPASADVVGTPTPSAAATSTGSASATPVASGSASSGSVTPTSSSTSAASPIAAAASTTTSASPASDSVSAGTASPAASSSSGDPTVTVDSSRGYAGYCTDGGITVDISIWAPDHHEFLRCAPDVTAADTNLDVLYKAGLVVDGNDHMGSVPSEPGWKYYDFGMIVYPVPHNGWNPMTAAAQTTTHPSTAYLRWEYGDNGRWTPGQLTAGTLYVGLSDPDPAPGDTEQIWVTNTAPLEQITVKVNGAVVSPADYQVGINNMTPKLSVTIPSGASGPVTVTATGASPSRTGSATYTVGGMPPTVAANPDPSIVSVWRPCQKGTGITVVVDFNSLGDGDVEVGCALFLPGESLAAQSLAGTNAMTRAGFGVAGTNAYGDAVLCRVLDRNGVERPTASQSDCTGMPGASAYWSYWHGSPGDPGWSYSGYGISGKATEVEGWSFSTADGSTIAPRIKPQDATGYHPLLTTVTPNPSSNAALASVCSFLTNQLDQSSGSDPYQGGSEWGSTELYASGYTYSSAAVEACGKTASSSPGLSAALQQLNNPAGWGLYSEIQAPPGGVGDSNHVYGKDAVQALQNMQILKDAGLTVAEPYYSTMISTIENLFNPNTGILQAYGDGPNGSNSASFPTQYQAEAMRSLSALGEPVPAVAIDYLLSQQNKDGSFTVSAGTPVPSGDTGAAQVRVSTAEAVKALAAAKRAHRFGAGGENAIDVALARSGAYLTGLQNADGSFPNAAGIDDGGNTWDGATAQAASTAYLARALADAGQSVAAAKAARWVTQFQLTADDAALADGKPGESAIGGIADSIDGLTSLIKGRGVGVSGAGIVSMLAAFALAAAPNADPATDQLAGISVSQITSTTATVSVTVQPASTDQSLSLDYIAGGGKLLTTAAQTVPGSTNPDTASPVTLSFQLTGLAPDTDYTAYATLTGKAGLSIMGPDQAFTTDVAAFVDVPSSNMFHTQIMWLAGKGVTTGWPQDDGTYLYKPLDSIHRDAMAAFLYRLAGSPAYTAPTVSPFTDLKPSDQYYKEICWLRDQGITTGYSDGSYRPLDSVNRDAMAAFLYRYDKSPQFTAPAVSPFTDVHPGDQFYKEMTWLAAQKISTGWPDGSYRPVTPVARDAMAAFLYRIDNGG